MFRYVEPAQCDVTKDNLIAPKAVNVGLQFDQFSVGCQDDVGFPDIRANGRDIRREDIVAE